jgi:hypothetical protein
LIASPPVMKKEGEDSEEFSDFLMEEISHQFNQNQ